MGFLSGIQDADPNMGRNPFVPAGKFLLKVTEMEGRNTRKSGPAFEAHFEIMESDNPAFKVGTHLTWMQQLRFDGSLGRIRTFLAAVAGCHTDDITDADSEEAIGKAQPLVDRLVCCEAYDTVTQVNKKDIVATNWSAYVPAAAPAAS